MKTNNYNIEKIIEFLTIKGNTNFINQQELLKIKSKLNKNTYKIYELYPDCNKVILYKKNIPTVKLLKICSGTGLRHQDILGAVFSLGLKDDMFGDILKYNGNYYIYVVPLISTYLQNSLNSIRNTSVVIEEVPLSIANNFIQEFITYEIIVSSLRIDNVISSLIKLSRQDVLIKFKNKEIVLNYKEELKPARTLKENDIFSVKNFGKFKYYGIIKRTKKGGFIIKILKYN